MADIVDIRCPKCGRWLAEASEYGRAVCRDCGWSVEVRSKAARNGHEVRVAKQDLVQ